MELDVKLKQFFQGSLAILDKIFEKQRNNQQQELW